MRPIRLIQLLGLAVLGLSLTACSADNSSRGGADGDPPSADSTVPQLRREGRWLVDPQNRVVLVHGQNLVWKLAPYLPPDSPEGFTAADADWLRDHGFNGARIGVLWAGVTPEAPGVVDENYLRQWDRIIQLLASRGIWMQFDFHQDQWHETYGGEGVPAWAVQRPLPYSLAPPATAPFPLGYWLPELSTVFDQFWANTGGLQEGWAAAWQAVAARWRQQPYSMGYDLLNEPWAGLEWPDCLFTGCASHYSSELQPAFERVLAAIRQVDPDGIVWFEPQQFAGGRDTPTFFEPVAGENQLGYSWHNYCPQVFFESQGVPVIPGAPGVPGVPLGPVSECLAFSDSITRHALQQGERMGAVGLMSEFGATDNLEALAIDTAVADQHFTSWMHWAYKVWSDPTTADTAQGLFEDDADLSSVKEDKLRLLMRTYPQATAGIPQALTFDPDTAAFEYRYTPRAARGPTEIFVPVALHYPQGYALEVSGAKSQSAGNAGRLKLENLPGATEVTVRITRR